MAEFKQFADAVQKRFAEMCEAGNLFEVAWEPDELWAAYLAAFPDGTNPVFLNPASSTHNCSICRGFIRRVGNVVAIQNGALSSIWDLNGLTEPYQTVADRMSEHVKSSSVRDTFWTEFAKLGQAISRTRIDEREVTFHHFMLDVPRKHVTQEVATDQARDRATHDVLVRALTELKPESVADVLDLIEQNVLHRGMENKGAIKEFQELQKSFGLARTGLDRDLFVWLNIGAGANITRLRSTSIGSLIVDLSDGRTVEEAVKSYHVKVDPANYRRTSAPITARMVTTAVAKIQELGLEPALERRHANIGDMHPNNIYFVDNAFRSRMKGGLADLLMSEVKPKAASPVDASEITPDELVSLLSGVQQVELLVENGLLNNFMSVTAPVHEDAPRIFKWHDNAFAWSYEGNLAGASIRDRVKKAGGRVENVSLRVSLGWFNVDDLDIHAVEPSGNHIFFRNKCDVLDVDMNAGRHATTREPVENLRWLGRLRDGVYGIYVNQYAKRESIDVGFEIEIESPTMPKMLSYRYNKAVLQGQNIPVANITVVNGIVSEVRVMADMEENTASKEVWGIKTQSFARVSSVLLSPNYWAEPGVLNKQLYFILDGCLNPEPARGFYNEMLRSELVPHRHVFETLADKTKCQAKWQAIHSNILGDIKLW